MITHNGQTPQQGMTVKALKDRGGFQKNVTYQVWLDKRGKDTYQVYTRNTKEGIHIYCHGGIKEVNEHFELVAA